MSELKIAMGAMSDSLTDQFKSQGFEPPKDIDHFQKDADAITRLKIRGLLTDSQSDSARKKLMKELAK